MRPYEFYDASLKDVHRIGRLAWLARVYAGRVRVISAGSVRDHLLAGRLVSEQDSRRIKRILRKLRRRGLVCVKREGAVRYKRTHHVVAGPYVPARPTPKSLRREKRGRHV